jgi:hypothetical protein
LAKFVAVMDIDVLRDRPSMQLLLRLLSRLLQLRVVAAMNAH